MKETKDQTIERLKAIIAEQKEELTQVKKDRKRLNYAVERLEKQINNAPISSTEDDVQIEELGNEVEVLNSIITEKETEWEKKEKRLIETIKSKEFHYKKLLEAYNNIDAQVRKEYDGYVDETLKAIATFQKWTPPNRTNLERYTNGEKTYIIRENNTEREELIFSPKDLFIQIHPKTGHRLTNIHFKILEHWRFLQYEYGGYFGAYDDWCNRHHMDDDFEKWQVENAYNVGKKLLPYYEHLLF